MDTSKSNQTKQWQYKSKYEKECNLSIYSDTLPFAKCMADRDKVKAVDNLSSMSKKGESRWKGSGIAKS